jgi:hypothetical protein
VTRTSPPLARAGSPARRTRRPAGPATPAGRPRAGPGAAEQQCRACQPEWARAADVTRRRPVPRPRQCTATQRQWTRTRASLPVASCERAPSHDRRDSDPQVPPLAGSSPARQCRAGDEWPRRRPGAAAPQPFFWTALYRHLHRSRTLAPGPERHSTQLTHIHGHSGWHGPVTQAPSPEGCC